MAFLQAVLDAAYDTLEGLTWPLEVATWENAFRKIPNIVPGYDELSVDGSEIVIIL